MNRHKFLTVFVFLFFMVSIDEFVFVGYFYELRRNVDLYLHSLGLVLLFALILRGLLAWALASKILNINDKKVAIFLSIPILTTEAVIRDILFGMENVTKVIEETNNLGAYTIFIWLTTLPKMWVMEHIYRSGIADSPLTWSLIDSLGFVLGGVYDVIVCELWRIGVLMYFKKL